MTIKKSISNYLDNYYSSRENTYDIFEVMRNEEREHQNFIKNMTPEQKKNFLIGHMKNLNQLWRNKKKNLGNTGIMVQMLYL